MGQATPTALLPLLGGLQVLLTKWPILSKETTTMKGLSLPTGVISKISRFRNTTAASRPRHPSSVNMGNSSRLNGAFASAVGSNGARAITLDAGSQLGSRGASSCSLAPLTGS
ncbi:hypothetical protein B0H67DRAFT_83311 [Lasiosphaeris hirsuta]|uniref:Uncharacterized protein n=1 Tax=Lasiosphaeris hirsuta TaxID=260670 RepID=A0AA40BCE5_9PEZI|nr:hypothetical protein B0H67DRAFT_83311 [Lasiosphaeris hirsuta]